MDLETLLNLKLKNDLIHELNTYFKDDSLKNRIEFLVNEKIKLYKIDIDDVKCTKSSISDENRCCARSMGPTYTDIRCNHIKKNNTDYCNFHLKRLDEYGFLKFGRYDEKRPTINEKGNKIVWRDNTAMQDINTIIQYQHMNLMKLISK